jgi:hypothetical protein
VTRPYVPRPGDPYPAFAFLVVYHAGAPVPVRTIVMLIRQPARPGQGGGAAWQA